MCPALILMDLHMPLMDVLDATRQLREIEELCGMVIVAFSAFGSGEQPRGLNFRRGGRRRAVAVFAHLVLIPILPRAFIRLVKAVAAAPGLARDFRAVTRIRFI